MHFSDIYDDIRSVSILSCASLSILYHEITQCTSILGNTAEVGVYRGSISKMIALLNQDKLHYCYDSFCGIIHSTPLHGDKHKNGEFICTVDEVKEFINTPDVLLHVVYKVGIFPTTFAEQSECFSFVYSDTATYNGTVDTLHTFAPCMTSKGKIVFYVGKNCTHVVHAITHFYNNHKDIYGITKYTTDVFLVLLFHTCPSLT